jgi:hypothetical protein
MPLTIGDTEVPHWAERQGEEWALFEDFPTFREEVWKHLGLPSPTRAQLRMARRLRRDSGGWRDSIRAIRGVGKSCQKDYDCFTLPARCPLAGKLASCSLRRNDGVTVCILDPWIVAEMEAARLRPSMPIDPERFDNDELLKRERESKGRSFFALQYMLDTSLSDSERCRVGFSSRR